MLYRSTRGGVSGLPFERTLLSAYAADGGLFVPHSLPTLTADELRSWAPLTLAQVCAQVMERFVDLPLAQLDALAAAAFNTFNGGHEPPLPLRRVCGTWLLETGNGPTLAFKDVGQQVVARLLDVYLARRGGHATVIVETSGDTGPAAIAGVAGMACVDIHCLYPAGRVSDVQELQMVTCTAENVHVYRTEGDTDEQAEALKEVFSDADFMKRHSVCSINSINWARVMVQSSYYVWAYLQLRPSVDGPVDFAVPTGAFGNACGGLIARLMGLPIGRIVCATNANDVVHRTLSAGDMAIGPNVQTLSPAMDIQFAYNIERALYFVSGGDTSTTRRLMAAAEARAPEPLPAKVRDALREVFLSVSVSDAATLATMATVYRESGYTLDPHSAIGVHAHGLPAVANALAHAHGSEPVQGPARGRARGSTPPVVCVLTAHPAKFDDACKRAGIPPATLPSVDALRSLPHRFVWLRSPPPPDHTPARKRSAWARSIKAAVERAAAERGRRRRAPTSRL